MNSRYCLVGVLAIVMATLLVGCSPGKRPFLMDQMCLLSEQDVSELVGELKSIARDNSMSFLDNSANTKQSLDAVGYAGSERTQSSPVIDVHVLRQDGMGVGVGNLGLPGYQIALGFSEGSSALESRQFAVEVVRRLQRHWKVKEIPTGTGAKPMTGCE